MIRNDDLLFVMYKCYNVFAEEETNMGYSLYNNKKKRQRMIIFFVIGVLIVISIIGIVFFVKKQEVQKNIEEELSDIDTTIVGDASIDPENIDVFNENGVDVNADSLVGIDGRSNGIDVSKWQGKIDW